jgi:hypothetical protein
MGFGIYFIIVVQQSYFRLVRRWNSLLVDVFGDIKSVMVILQVRLGIIFCWILCSSYFLVYEVLC